MSRLKWILIVAAAAFAGAVGGTLATFRYIDGSVIPYNSIEKRQQIVLARSTPDSIHGFNSGLDFKRITGKVVDAVVHIKVTYGPGKFSLNPLEYYYDPPARSSGSGVIVTDDGYILTNNHVIENATNIEVVLKNNQRYFANVVGRDEDTDLALLKIKGRNFPFLQYGNSDEVYPGDWVLAVGNPFDLNSTVTAGIVSAKARNIGALRDRNNLAIESFIQTDAAVNPGNSGGALVNLNGELVGINTAIATTVGKYAGYSFAIPVNLVKKVADDLLEYGKVQRGLLGVVIRDVDAVLAENFGLPVSQGVYVRAVNTGSGADESGMKTGDVIIGINDYTVTSVAELQALVSEKSPGETVRVVFLRQGQEHSVTTMLMDMNGGKSVDYEEVKDEFDGMKICEATFKQLNDLNIDGGIVVSQVDNGVWAKAGLKKNFVICYIDKIAISNLDDFNDVLRFKRGGILVEGYQYPSGERGVYGVDLRFSK